MPTIDQQVQRKKPKTQTRTQPRTQRHRDPRKTPGSTTVSSPGPNKDIPGLVWYSGMAWQGGRGRGGGREGGRRQWKREGVGVGESAICSISSPPPILPIPLLPTPIPTFHTQDCSFIQFSRHPIYPRYSCAPHSCLRRRRLRNLFTFLSSSASCPPDAIMQS